MFNFIKNFYLSSANFANTYLFPILVFFIRFHIAKIFWYSGLTKISSWKSTLYLFKYEYSVPYIPSNISAILATGLELTMPCLLLLGFMTRLSAIPLLVMTAVIQFTYLHLNDHIYWSILLLTIILYGPGKYSIDHLIFIRMVKK